MHTSQFLNCEEGDDRLLQITIFFRNPATGGGGYYGGPEVQNTIQITKTQYMSRWPRSAKHNTHSQNAIYNTQNATHTQSKHNTHTTKTQYTKHNTHSQNTIHKTQYT